MPSSEKALYQKRLLRKLSSTGNLKIVLANISKTNTFTINEKNRDKRSAFVLNQKPKIKRHSDPSKVKFGFFSQPVAIGLAIQF